MTALAKAKLTEFPSLSSFTRIARVDFVGRAENDVGSSLERMAYEHTPPLAVFKPSPCFNQERAAWAAGPCAERPVSGVRRLTEAARWGRVFLTWKL